jgi:uncharacterized YigZ family protein
VSDSYKTILQPSHPILYKDRGSKFYATAFPLTTDKEMEDIIQSLRKDHPKAGHHCYAWKLGAGDDNYRVNDDGEPRNSAGAPIYGQILSYELSDIAVVVSRIFGGTKLGVSGLIHAYREAASVALDSCQIVKRTIVKSIEISFEYPQMSQVMRFIEEHQFTIKNQELTTSCKITITVPQSRQEEYVALINTWYPITARALD